MSAIAGIMFLDNRDVAATDIERFVAATPHGGRAHSWRSGPTGLIRLGQVSTPEAALDCQPRTDRQFQSVICFDGRLDNRSELLRMLANPQPSDVPDSELALALYEQMGESFLDHLTGDYAFAIWAPARRRLFCARSPLGWRPFLWTFNDRRFAFASQPRTLVEGAGVERILNEGAIGEFLAVRFTSPDETFWRDIHRLPGGAALTIANGRPQIRQWHGGPFEDLRDLSEAEHVERFRTLFDQSLIATSRSASPVAAQLSGGLDSSSVVCRAFELQRVGRLRQDIRVITARFPGEPFDETKWSGAVEDHLGIRATAYHPGFEDWDAQRDWCASTLHLPLRPNLMTPVCRQLQSQGVRVLLTGEGGDDWFAGSRGHWPDLILQGRWARLLRESRGSGLLRRAKRIAVDGFGPIVSRSMRLKAEWPHLGNFNFAVPDWIDGAWARRIGLADRWRRAATPTPLPSYAQRQRWHAYSVPRRHINVENVLAYCTAHDIELRHPLHDLRLTKFVMGAAGNMLLRNGQKKYLLRQAMSGTLPEIVKSRSCKANFSALIVRSVSQRLLDRNPDDLLCVKMGWVQRGKVAAIHAQYVNWLEAGGARPQSHYGAAWTAVAFDAWLEHAFRI